jgi:cobalt-zinc-cadmium efflux system outer membrane protein
MRTIAFYALVVVCAFGNVYAQSLTMSDAVHEALARNPALQAQRRDSAAASADIVTAGLAPTNPQLTVNGDMFPTGGAFAPDNKMYGVSVAFPFELGGKRDARMAFAERTREATVAGIADAERQIVAQVRDAFFDALRARAQADLAAATARSLDSVTTLNRIRLAGRDIAATELDRSIIAADRARLDAASARLAAAQALAALQMTMGRNTPDATLTLEGDLHAPPVAPAPSLTAAKDFARDHRADLMAARAAVTAEDENVRLQEANAAIDLSVSADFSRQQGTTFYGSTISVPLPLYNRNQGEREKATVRVARAKDVVRAIELRVDSDTESAYCEFESRGAIVMAMRDSILPRVRSVRESVKYSYTGGHATILDLLDAERTYLDVMKDFTDTLAAWHKSAGALESAMGKL